MDKGYTIGTEELKSCNSVEPSPHRTCKVKFHNTLIPNSRLLQYKFVIIGSSETTLSPLIIRIRLSYEIIMAYIVFENIWK